MSIPTDLTVSFCTSIILNAMAPNQVPSSGFAGFPREIRDMVFAELASAAELSCSSVDDASAVKLGGSSFDKTLRIQCDEGEYGGCIKMLHDWASRSHIAKEACEELWAHCPFRGKWDPKSGVIIGPEPLLYLEYYDNERRTSEIVPLGATIKPCNLLREIRLKVYPALDDSYYSNPQDQPNLHRLDQELAKLARFPRLHKLRMKVLIPRACDPYHKGMVVVESLSQSCRSLRRRLGMRFNFILIRERPMSWIRDELMNKYNVGWMWDPPTSAPRASIPERLSDVEEHIRALMAKPKKNSILLRKLRAAAAKLPRNKKEILQMKEWSAGTGLSMQDWLWFKWFREVYKKGQ